jgi:hypothetical protein
MQPWVISPSQLIFTRVLTPASSSADSRISAAASHGTGLVSVIAAGGPCFAPEASGYAGETLSVPFHDPLESGLILEV